MSFFLSTESPNGDSSEGVTRDAKEPGTTIMKKRSVFLYWALLLIPAVFMGVVGVRLLASEQERRDQMERSSALEAARAVAQTIRITMEGLEQQIIDGLITIPRETRLDTLLSWQKQNPSIRNIFIWQPGAGLQYPNAREPASSELARFMIRYQNLFTARASWLANGSGEAGDARIPGAGKKLDKSSFAAERIYDEQVVRQSFQHQQFRPQAKHGWIPWFSDNRLHILGWVQQSPTDAVYGVELETVTFISLLIEKFPRSEIKGAVFALLDDSDRLLHQIGGPPIEPTTAPALEVSLSPHLPHWRVALYFDPQTVGFLPKNAFIIIAGLLLATLIVAILLGGALLTRQAYSHWQDAQQKSSFVSNVSHELKTPLTTIRMYAELLNEGIIQDSEKKRQYLQVIVSEAERLTRLVNNVLGFSRLEQGRMNYHIQDIVVGEFIESFLNTNDTRVRESGMSAQAKMPKNPVVIRVDRDALEQTFLNILDNAIKYAAEGGSLEIAVSVNGSMCEIRFLDRGPGIPVSHRDKIFDKFQRVDEALSTGKVGTGLGLTIARYMMRDLQGDVVFEPRASGGSCFVISVPLADEKES